MIDSSTGKPLHVRHPSPDVLVAVGPDLRTINVASHPVIVEDGSVLITPGEFFNDGPIGEKLRSTDCKFVGVSPRRECFLDVWWSAGPILNGPQCENMGKRLYQFLAVKTIKIILRITL